MTQMTQTIRAFPLLTQTKKAFHVCHLRHLRHLRPAMMDQ
jgi:hypothetical protein